MYKLLCLFVLANKQTNKLLRLIPVSFPFQHLQTEDYIHIYNYGMTSHSKYQLFPFYYFPQHWPTYLTETAVYLLISML